MYKKNEVHIIENPSGHLKTWALLGKKFKTKEN